jgi:CrcB protein
VSRGGGAGGHRPSASDVLLVAAGGAAGTALRYLVTSAAPSGAGLPAAVLAINVLGAGLLGALLEVLTGSGPDAGTSRRIRLLMGTGVLGGFTTYSTLATDTLFLLGTSPALALGYAIATIVVGGAASIAGIWCARRLRSPTGATPR